MVLDRNYFNSINLFPIKRKYYDIKEVDNLLVDIRKQAELINHRYQDMQEELEGAKAGREDYRIKGQALSQEVITLREKLAEAEKRAAEAEEKANAFETALEKNSRHLAPREDEDRSDNSCTYRMEQFEEMYKSMRKLFTSGVDTLDRQWSQFVEKGSDSIPADLSSKIGKIAMVMEEINSDI